MQAEIRVKRAGAAVCAHIGRGADDREAKLARDRLAVALEAYRPGMPAKRD